MAILTKPSRSYTASVMSSDDSNRRAAAKDRPGKEGIKVYRPRELMVVLDVDGLSGGAWS